jgi:hypothetical protein
VPFKRHIPRGPSHTWRPWSPQRKRKPKDEVWGAPCGARWGVGVGVIGVGVSVRAVCGV